MMVGDIVLTQYSSRSIPGTYCLGRIIAVEQDADNLVRTCQLKYHLLKPINADNRESTSSNQDSSVSRK